MNDRCSVARWQPLAMALLLLAACGGGTSDQPRSEAARSIAADGGLGSSTPPAASAAGAPAPSTHAGSGADGGVAAPACELLSEADIIEVTTWGPATVEPGAQQGIFPNGCYWELAGGTSAGMGAPASITLGVMPRGGQEYYDAYFAPFAEENDEEPLVGVGDVGLIGSPSGTVMAVKDDVLVSLQWIDIGGDETAVAIALIDRVLANLAGG